MILLRGGADIDHRDVRVLDDVLVVERRGRRSGERLHLGQPVRADFADVQLVHQRGARQRLRTDAAAPAGNDYCDFNLLHALPLYAWQRRSRPRAGGDPINTELLDVAPSRYPAPSALPPGSSVGAGDDTEDVVQDAVRRFVAPRIPWPRTGD